MELEWDTRPHQHRVGHRQQWQDQQQPPVSFSPPQSMLAPASPPSQLAQRRRSAAANTRPAGPPPNLPMPSLPPSSSLPQPPSAISETSDPPSYLSSTSSIQRTAHSASFGRPSASPNLSAVAAFSQARQASSSAGTSLNQSQSMTSSLDDLSDPPPQSYLPPSSSRFSDRNLDSQAPQAPPERERSLLAPPTENSHRSEHRPSSRRALTRALELAREAVQLDSTNESPEAAVNAYAQSVALLSEVMERVRNGEDSTDSHRRRRRRSVAAQEEEVKRLQNIHDTYADRMNILSIIYSIPAVPYPASSLYSNGVSDSTTSNSPTTSASPSSDSSPHIPQQSYTPFIHEELQDQASDIPSDGNESDNPDAVYTLDEAVLRGAAISGLPSTTHPYSVQYDAVPQPPLPTSSRASVTYRRIRASSNLPPKPPPPAASLPPAPVLSEPPAETSARAGDPHLQSLESNGYREATGHKRTSSGLRALEEESEDGTRLGDRPYEGVSDNQKYNVETPRTLTRRESPPLPPLPSPTTNPDQISPPPRSVSLSKPPSSPRLASIIAPRPRGTSTLTTRNELANVPHIRAPSNGSISQRRNNPPSTRSSSPDSTASAGSVPYPIPAVSTMPTNGFTGRNRSSSQPGRRPSLIGGRPSSPEQRPPMPSSSGTNGTPRKVSVPSRLNPPLANLQMDYLPSNSVGFPGNLPTTPTSPLPPAPPPDPLLKPYHMMNLLRNTMTSSTGGYVTRRLHVPCEVWSQGGAKLLNLDEKIRVVTILCGALEDLQGSSVDYFGAGNVSIGLALGIGSIGRKEAEAWIAKLEEFNNVCVGVVTSFGKKLGVGEGFVSRKTTLGDKITRRLDKFTNGKNLDSPAAYVQGLKKLFQHVQLLDEHTRAVLSQPIAPSYGAFPLDTRTSAEQKLKRSSEFFASVVLTFVIRDLSQLLDKYVKKCEKWLAE